MYSSVFWLNLTASSAQLYWVKIWFPTLIQFSSYNFHFFFLNLQHSSKLTSKLPHRWTPASSTLFPCSPSKPTYFSMTNIRRNSKVSKTLTYKKRRKLKTNFPSNFFFSLFFCELRSETSKKLLKVFTCLQCKFIHRSSMSESFKDVELLSD